MLSNPVVVHFKDGNITKGYLKKFAFYRDEFILLEVDKKNKIKSKGEKSIDVANIKAIFFVRDLEGNKDYQERLDMAREGFGDRVEVTFDDGEHIVGYAKDHSAKQNGFILYPADSNSNNYIVGVFHSSIKDIKVMEGELATA
ncbi:MAG: hypothetical protein AABY79_07135 [Nitrospirota bacterium]|jgi:hypothetical protein